MFVIISKLLFIIVIICREKELELRVAATGAVDPEKEVFETLHDVILLHFWCAVVKRC